MNDTLDKVASGSGWESVAYLDDVIGMILTVALAASLVAVAIATVRWMVFQGSERDGGRALASRWLHVAGALLAICIVYNGANALYTGLKENDLSNQIASEADSGKKSDMWKPSNMNEIVENAPDLGFHDAANNLSNSANSYDAARAYDAAQSFEEIENGAKQAAASATSSTSAYGKKEAGSSEKKGREKKASDNTPYNPEKCLLCGKTYKTKTKAAKCARKDQEKLAASSTKGANSSNKYTVKIKKGSEVYTCAKCGKEQKSAYFAEYCYSIYPKSF